MRFPHGKSGLQSPILIRVTHDMVANVLAGTFSSPFPADDLRLKYYTEVLCWVLGHTEPGFPGHDFEESIHKLAGHILVDAGIISPEALELEGETPVERVN